MHPFYPVAQKACARFGIPAGDAHPAQFAGHNATANHITNGQGNAGGDEQPKPGGIGAQIKAEHVFEVSQAVVAAKAHLIAEEGQHQRKGQRLRDDRQVYTGHP